MALSDLLLRTLSHPILANKGSALTWVEEDTNFVELYEAAVLASDFTNSGVAAYDSGTTYTEDDIVSYAGSLYTYINPVDGSGNAPTDPTYWELTGGASLAHVQNKDQYLDLGGTYEVSAQEIREFIDTPLDISTKWDITGNTLSARGKLGSTSGAYGFDILVNNVVKAAVSNSGAWVFGGDTPYTSQTTTATFKGTGNTSSTNTFVGLNSADALIFKLRDDGGFIFYEDLYDSTPTKFVNIANRIFYTTGSVGAIALNEFALYPNNSFSSLEWDLRIQKDSTNDEVLDWENLEFTKNWRFNNVAIMATYTVATLPTNVTGGLIYVNDESGGAVLAFSDGSNWRRVTDRAIVS